MRFWVTAVLGRRARDARRVKYSAALRAGEAGKKRQASPRRRRAEN
jgi:hypothetical protein